MDNYLNNLAELSEFTDSNLIESLIVNFIKFLGYFIVALIIYKNKSNLQYQSTFSNWSLNPNTPNSIFGFLPPPNAKLISILKKS